MINLEEERTAIEIELKEKFENLKLLQGHIGKTILTAKTIISEIIDNVEYSNIETASKTKIINIKTKINNIEQELLK